MFEQAFKNIDDLILQALCFDGLPSNGGVGGVMVNQLAPLGFPGNRRGTAARRSDAERACYLNDTTL
jgi:hypothetical protein